ncbi:MAG TPA: FAD-dependent oxidoreductase [Pirellulaceae bacterium]|nr:FAD-dependent oxidoreductase [Pirellulaceae bacterium]
MNHQPILILGGGINGAAAARELTLNGAGVWLVDTADLSFGATAYSSRLIHGGLRYLEFAEFSLVKESLDERARLLRLAPHLVKPLRLFIPVRNSWGGFTQAAGKFLGLPLRFKRTAHRGLRVVQVGLWLYDRYASGGDLPPRSLHEPIEPGVPRVSQAVATHLWAYSDAQITYPERLVIALLDDARKLAQQHGSEFRVFTYSRATLHGSTTEIRPTGDDAAAPLATLKPAAIINATGAWVDRTLARLPVESRRLMGGTKGSHFLTYHRPLREALAGQGVYTEASDGRPVFLLPFGEGTLVGTTDIPFEGDPATAVATEQELDYLVSVATEVFPDVGLTRGDIKMHQCGVRPLPYADAKSTAAITRRHQLVWSDHAPVPLVSLVGGKLTTCRSLAEETTAAVLDRLGKRVEQTSRERPIPRLQVDEALAAGIQNWRSIAASSIQHEWATRLEDLVERRLMLHFQPRISRNLLGDLAAALVQCGHLDLAEAESAINRCTDRLKTHFGVNLTPDS